MKAATRILQALALLGAVASGLFYFLGKSAYQQSDSDLQRLNADYRSERAKSKSLQQELEELRSQSEGAQEEIEQLTSDALLANNQLLQLRRENQRLKDALDAQERAERRLQAENGRLTEELNSLKATSVPREQVAEYEQAISRLEREVLDLQQTQARQPQSAALPDQLPPDASLRGKVLTVGKGASFVVLDIGYHDGVRLQTELYIQHADTPIAKIQVTEVKENLSIARVLPESLTKTPQSGDSVSSLN